MAALTSSCVPCAPEVESGPPRLKGGAGASSLSSSSSSSSSKNMPEAAEEEKKALSWRPESSAMDDWSTTTTSFLPFLEFHEFKSLRSVGSTSLAMPFSPFFSLFLARESAHAAAYHAKRGLRRYDEGDWASDAMYQGRVRVVRYEAAVVSDDGAARVCSLREEQRCLLRHESLIYEARIQEEPDPEKKEDLITYQQRRRTGRGG
eukprot:CAMPEP_0118899568 /NCGR_PEP_ID=MMETSP1166-20130328/6071_1 /TAXON_ID=1104430 /ORGANISM="Chrysoreinhardia sp, Strain CCMP3193" /LENGTH=204 /DNA_ID=CAMNT_0006838699 /DNA_START=64 /DNA_END=674 /DNA_ORIENTATION=-